MINLNKIFKIIYQKKYISTCSRFSNCLISKGIILDHISDAQVGLARATA